MATVSRRLKITGLFCRISSLLQGSFAKETCHFKEPTDRSHPIEGKRRAKKQQRKYKKTKNNFSFLDDIYHRVQHGGKVKNVRVLIYIYTHNCGKIYPRIQQENQNSTKKRMPAEHTARHCNALQRTTTHRNALQHTAIQCNTLETRHTAMHCNTLQHDAMHCNTVQYGAKH